MRSLLLLLLLLVARLAFSQDREIDSLKRVYASSKTDTVRLQALTDLNWAYLFVDIAQAKRYAAEELALSTKVSNRKFTAQAYNDLGIVYWREGLLDSALVLYNKSLTIRKTLNDKNAVASSLSKLSNVYAETGHFMEALEAAFETLKIYEEASNIHYQALTLNNIAVIYQKLNNPLKSIVYSKKSLQISLNQDDHDIGTAYYNLGNSSFDLTDYQKAREYYLKGLRYFIKTGDRQGEAAVYNGMALVLRAMKKNTEALAYYEKAFDLSVKENNKIDIEIYRENMAWVLLDLKNYGKALKLITENSKSIDPANQQRLLVNYKQLASVYAFVNHADSAQSYLNKFATLSDSIYSESSAAKIANAEKSYETQKKEKENKILVQQNNIQALENENNRKTIYILAAIILLVALIFAWQISLSHIKKQKRALEVENKLRQDRERISRDLHDNVGGQLSYVLFSLEADEEASGEQRKQKTDNLANTLRSVTGNLREAIWALNQEKLSLKNISDRLKIYARQVFLQAGTKIKFEEAIESDEPLNSVYALNLFRICQEAINNVFKHAKASELTISVVKRGKESFIAITDNGVGFNAEMVSSESFGLSNMQKRAQEINAQVVITSTPSKGTSITVIV